ncbi:MAG: hypothetical protein ACE5HJ_07895 [Thermoplasmata archaeon]
MRELKDIFSDTLFLGAGKGMRGDEDRLWMIAEHVYENETVLAFLSLKKSNLLLTQDRLLELKPHLDTEGFWNVLSFKGYEIRREVYLREVLGFYLEVKGTQNASLHLQVGEEEIVFAVPLADASADPGEDLEVFGDCLHRVLKAKK